MMVFLMMLVRNFVLSNRNRSIGKRSIQAKSREFIVPQIQPLNNLRGLLYTVIV